MDVLQVDSGDASCQARRQIGNGPSTVGEVDAQSDLVAMMAIGRIARQGKEMACRTPWMCIACCGPSRSI